MFQLYSKLKTVTNLNFTKIANIQQTYNIFELIRSRMLQYIRLRKKFKFYRKKAKAYKPCFQNPYEGLLKVI